MASSLTMVTTGALSGGTRRVELTWVSAADGTVAIATPCAIEGVIRKVCFVPSSTAAPTALYDVTLTDPNSIDILAGQGANLANNANTNVCPGVPLKDGTTTSVTPQSVNDILTLNVSNAGDTKSGKVILYLGA